MSRVGIIRIAIIVGAFGLLELCCRLGMVDPVSVAAPTAMIASAAKILVSAQYLPDIFLTLYTVAAAAVISIVVGFGLGVVLFIFPRLKRAANPFLASYYTVPTFIFYPLFIVMFGLNRWPLIAIAFVFSFVAMAIATADGFLSVRPIFRRAGQSMRLSNAQMLRLVMLPAASPYLFTGVKLAISYAFIGVVAGEFVQAGAGIGFQIAFAYQSFDTDTMYGLMLILLVFVVVINAVLWSIERKLYSRMNF
jgi:NitT/TauT family transport system permease protein